jgi:uncharacterized protein YbaA (DUF1428 family)
MSYVDGFVIVVSTKKLNEYWKMAREGKKAWMKHGAVDYKECMGDDLTPKDVFMPFPKLAKAKPDETVIFSYIVFKSRKHRDAVNKKVMAEFAKKYSDQQSMPFDMKRFSYGGFKVQVSA